MKKNIISYCLFSLFAFCVTGSVMATEQKVVDDVSSFSIAANEIDIYPNPAVDHIFLKFATSEARDASIEIRSFIGNEMTAIAEVQQSDLIKVDISNLPAGHYYAVVTIKEAKTLKKFIKRS